MNHLDDAVDLVALSFFASLGTELRACVRIKNYIKNKMQIKKIIYSPEKEHLIRAVFTVELNEIFELGMGFPWQLLLRCRLVGLLVVGSIVE